MDYDELRIIKIKIISNKEFNSLSDYMVVSSTDPKDWFYVLPEYFYLN